MTAPTVATPIDSKRPSRRALLAGALGGAAAWLTAARLPGRVSAANGDPVLLGASHTATAATTITNTSNASDADAFRAVATAGTPGDAITGTSQHGNGVVGETNDGYGVLGKSSLNPGVRGESNMGLGVSGQTNNEFGYGVGGLNTASGGTGVGGQAFGTGSKGVAGFTAGGAALYGEVPPGEESPGIGLALQTVGRIQFSTSGVAIIAPATTSVTVAPGVDVVPGAFVLLTPRINLGGRSLWFTTDPTADSFTIHMSSARSTGTRIAWLLVG